MKLKLDTKTITGLALSKGRDEEIYWDTELEGFGYRLRRRTDGGLHPTWITQYRASGHTRRVTIGSAKKLTSPQAREAARTILARVVLGADPQSEKAAKRQQATRTLRSVVAAYLEAVQPVLRPSSFRVTKLYLTGPYFGPLHSMSVSEIEHPDIAARIRGIERSNSTTTAGAARRAISALFKWAAEEGLLGRNPINPVVNTRKPVDPEPRDHVLLDHELVAIWRACQDDDFGRVLKLLILLGNRRQEVGGMAWSEIDLQAGTWCLPKERSKNNHPHTIVLPTAALEIIRAVPQLVGRDHLFGVRAEGFTAWSRGKLDLDRRLAGVVRPWRIHDTRRTCATRMADLGVSPHAIESALNHYSGHRRGVGGVYNRSPYEREVTTALAVWAAHVLALVEDRTSTVVPFGRDMN